MLAWMQPALRPVPGHWLVRAGAEWGGSLFRAPSHDQHKKNQSVALPERLWLVGLGGARVGLGLAIRGGCGLPCQLRARGGAGPSGALVHLFPLRCLLPNAGADRALSELADPLSTATTDAARRSVPA